MVFDMVGRIDLVGKVNGSLSNPCNLPISSTTSSRISISVRQNGAVTCSWPLSFITINSTLLSSLSITSIDRDKPNLSFTNSGVILIFTLGFSSFFTSTTELACVALANCIIWEIANLSTRSF